MAVRNYSTRLTDHSAAKCMAGKQLYHGNRKRHIILKRNLSMIRHPSYAGKKVIIYHRDSKSAKLMYAFKLFLILLVVKMSTVVLYGESVEDSGHPIWKRWLFCPPVIT